MGLDTVEIVMEVEEAFAISIRNEDAEQIATLGQLADYVFDQLRSRPRVHCPSASGFYRLRRALIESWGVAREAIRPDVRIDDLMPERGRSASWMVLGGSLESGLPRLEHPAWVAPMAIAAYLATAAFLSWISVRFGGVGFEAIAFAGIASLLLCSFPLAFLLRMTETTVPAGCRTVGDAARLVGSRSFTAVDAKDRREEVWEKVRAIVAEQLGFPTDRLREDTHFVHDLGAD